MHNSLDFLHNILFIFLRRFFFLLYEEIYLFDFLIIKDDYLFLNLKNKTQKLD